MPVTPRIRWQYAVANLGTFGAAERLHEVLGKLGADGWELVGVYDKSSNWLAGMEKGFAMLKRPVYPGENPDEGWAVQVDRDGNFLPQEPSTDVPW